MDAQNKKRSRLFIAAITLLFLSAPLLLLNALNRGHEFHAGFGGGIGFSAADLATALQFFALILLPVGLVRTIRPAKGGLPLYLAAVLSLSVPLLFPLRFDFTLWDEYRTDTGRHAVDEYAWFGYRPLWRTSLDKPPFLAYETNDMNARESYTGNGLWGQRSRYQRVRKVAEGQRSSSHRADVYECLGRRTTHIFGFFWRDQSGDDYIYGFDPAPRDEFCIKLSSTRGG